MKKIFKLLFLLILISLPGFSHGNPDTSATSNWNFNASLYFNLIPDDFFILPIIKADKDQLHLELRYNYEDRNTASTWIGYNFQTGEELEFTATPMIAAVFGNANGAAPGLELDLMYSNIEFYSESEYLFVFEDGQLNYFYIWSELTYSPLDWLWFGIVGQRTRAYQSELDIQRGLLLGASYKNFQFTGYFYNISSDDAFVMLALAVDF